MTVTTERVPSPYWATRWFAVRAECVCGRRFRTRERYEQHWLTAHARPSVAR